MKKRKSIVLQSDWKNHKEGTAVTLPSVDAEKLIADGKAKALEGRYLAPGKPKPAKPKKKAAKKVE